LTNTLPSVKEFKDAIASLSPEQQDFARSFRAMQLESSVFGICIIQLKPQLERLLGLPDGALTKEIQLTQDLMSLFVDYQIPSDLLSFDGAEDSTVLDKVAAVKGYVHAVMDVIDSEKKKQLEEEVMKADMRAEMAYSESTESAANAQRFSFSSASLKSGSPPRAGGSTRTARRLKTEEVSSDPSVQPLMHQVQAVHPPAQNSALSLGSAESIMATIVPSPAPIESSMDPFHKPTEPTGIPTIAEDFTAIPQILDAKLEKYDLDNALRSTIIKASQHWIRKRQQNLLITASSTHMTKSDIDSEKKKAFDMLDAISRSGTLPIDSAELHVVIALSHCFENDVMYV
jgi:hypothetical protein